jgi:hypothetical protein
MNWFAKLIGAAEASPDQVRSLIVIDGEEMISQVNGRRMHWGRLENPSLEELRGRVPQEKFGESRLKLSEVVADVQQLHIDRANENALFQVASQFNLLEMVSPSVTPEAGVGVYENDRTQGPACAVACGAGTIYRNYFVPVGDQIGQTAKSQIDCLADLGTALGNDSGNLWSMKNGYALATATGLREISAKLNSLSESHMEQLRGRLRIGIQWNTEVTIAEKCHRVSQAYCSSLPVGYSEHAESNWADFATLVLEASYEATFHTAVLNMKASGCNKLYLTLIGGGVFGNRSEWIAAAILRALRMFKNWPLDVKLVSFRHSNPVAQKIIQDFVRN